MMQIKSLLNDSLKKLAIALLGLACLAALTTFSLMPVKADAASAISYVVATPLSDLAEPGSIVQVISKTHYIDGRASENTTSCFPCPTGDNFSNGTTTYKVLSGPGSFYGSKLTVSDSAVLGDVITFNASFTDNVSETSGTSANQTITVGSPAIEEVVVAEEVEEIAEVEEIVVEEIVVEEVEEVPAKGEIHEVAPEASVMEEEVMEEIVDEPVEVVEEVEKVAKVEKKASVSTHVVITNPAAYKSIPDYVLWIITIMVLLVIAAVVAKRRMTKIDHIAPEHRAKENELYEALGVEKPHEEMPKDHDEKEKEVEDAFRQS